MNERVQALPLDILKDVYNAMLQNKTKFPIVEAYFATVSNGSGIDTQTIGYSYPETETGWVIQQRAIQEVCGIRVSLTRMKVTFNMIISAYMLEDMRVTILEHKDKLSKLPPHMVEYEAKYVKMQKALGLAWNCLDEFVLPELYDDGTNRKTGNYIEVVGNIRPCIIRSDNNRVSEVLNWEIPDMNCSLLRTLTDPTVLSYFLRDADDGFNPSELM